MTEYTITREDAERDLRALRSVLSGFPVGVSSSALPALRELVWSIEAQVKPAVEEPTEFGSVVRATDRNNRITHWCRTYAVAVDEPWCTGNHMRSWADVIADATAVEVLRVGVGDEKAAPTKSKLAAEAAHAGVANSVTLQDHFSATTTLRIAEVQPQYNLVQLNAHRGASDELLSCDVDRGDFLDAVEKVLNVRILAPGPEEAPPRNTPRFCDKTPNCRMAAGHNGGCERS